VRKELQAFKESVIGMRSCVRPFDPGHRVGLAGDASAIVVDVVDDDEGVEESGGGGGGGADDAAAAFLATMGEGGVAPKKKDELIAATARWYWQESAQRLGTHAVVKPPHWIPYEREVEAALEASRRAGRKEHLLSDVYVVDLNDMRQVNARSGYGRAVLREGPPPPAAGGRRLLAAVSFEDRPADIEADEDCLLLREGAVVQIAQQRDDGWAFGSVVLAAEGSDDGAAPPAGWSADSGWFPLAHTDVPDTEHLAALQAALGGGGADALATPKYWDQVKDPLVAEYFDLSPASDEYRRAADAFLLTLDRRKVRIDSIQRVQNISLWQSYCVKLNSTIAREADATVARRKFTRTWLFHGAPGEIVPKILQQGFNRSFCGKNATFYGKGVYFARDAAYSAYPLYCQPDGRGLQSIFLCRCVVGQYCRGTKDALTPDVRDDSLNLLYDSTVNDVRNPEIYVTYHDAQAYPEYLVKFRTSGDPGPHPQTGNNPHPRYRPNALEGVE